MNDPSANRRWLMRAAGLLAVAVFVALVARFHHPVHGLTVFYQLDPANDDLKITAFRTLPVFVHHGTGGYDGLYYAQIAHDPTLRDPELPRAMDNLPYRARRILPPALAWLTGAGQPASIIHTYAWINLVAWLALAAILWRLVAVRDLRGLIAWAGVLFSAGALSSVRLALTDLPALTLLAAALLAIERGRSRSGLAALALSGLARETSLVAMGGVAEAPWFSRANLVRLAIVAAPLAAWLAYVRWAAGPADAGWANFMWPGSGLVEKVQADLRALGTVADRPLAWSTLLATIALVAQGAFFVVHRQPGERWWRIGAAYTAMMLFLGTAVWEGFPGAATRVVLPLNLAFNLIALRTRAPLAWLLAGNLTVLAGFVALRDVPHDPKEIAARTVGGTSAIVRHGDGWFGREQTRRHTWLWARETGLLHIERWSRGGAPLRLVFSLRGITPRTVVLRHEGREIWRGPIGTTATAHSVDLPGSAASVITLEFSSTEPPVPENASPSARALGFALYDLRLEATPP